MSTSSSIWNKSNLKDRESAKNISHFLQYPFTHRHSETSSNSHKFYNSLSSSEQADIDKGPLVAQTIPSSPAKTWQHEPIQWHFVSYPHYHGETGRLRKAEMMGSSVLHGGLNVPFQDTPILLKHMCCQEDIWPCYLGKLSFANSTTHQFGKVNSVRKNGMTCLRWQNEKWPGM